MATSLIKQKPLKTLCKIYQYYGVSVANGDISAHDNRDGAGIILDIPFPVKSFHFKATGDVQVGICSDSGVLPDVILTGANRVSFINYSAGIHDHVLTGWAYVNQRLFIGTRESGNAVISDMWFEGYVGGVNKRLLRVLSRRWRHECEYNQCITDKSDANAFCNSDNPSARTKHISNSDNPKWMEFLLLDICNTGKLDGWFKHKRPTKSECRSVVRRVRGSDWRRCGHHSVLSGLQVTTFPERGCA